MSVARLVLVATLLSPLLAVAQEKNLVANPGIDRARDWTNTGGRPRVRFRVDRRQGHARPGSLVIANESGADRIPHNWRQVVDLPEGAGRRLMLAASLRTAGLASGSSANVVAQCWNVERQQIHFASCAVVTGDQDWKRIQVVFETPPETRHVFVMAYLVGIGEAWFDDFFVGSTDEPVTAASPRNAAGPERELQELARGCAAEIPWIFDAAEARRHARERAAPVLIYVRCTDDEAGLPSARRSIEAADIRFRDDGYLKDVLFRAGPLSDSWVRDLVTRRFVPVCATYHLATQGRGRKLATWYSSARGGGGCRIDREEGGNAAGALRFDGTGRGSAGTWYQVVAPPPTSGTALKLRARVRAAERQSRDAAWVDLLFNRRGAAALEESSERLSGDADWADLELAATVPEGAVSVVVRFHASGSGTVWIDDVALAPAGSDGVNLVKDGSIEVGELSDPLEAWGLSSAEVVTPALVVVAKDGKVFRKLHRIGVLSADFIDLWLRTALEDLGSVSRAQTPGEFLRDGDLGRAQQAVAGRDDAASAIVRAEALLRAGLIAEATRALGAAPGPEADWLRAMIALREARWENALELLQPLAEDAKAARAPEAAWWAAFSSQRLGRAEEARKQWRALAGPTPIGRKAALAALTSGPRPWLAESVRRWPERVGRADQTETTDPAAFEPKGSVELLIEMQRGDGSFGGQIGVDGAGYSDAAITAIAADALLRWRPCLDAATRTRLDATVERVQQWLDAWSRRTARPTDAFNCAYALRHLAAAGHKQAAARVIAMIAATQNPDGNWSVYNPERPASFNTALCVLALTEAKAAGLAVPRKTLRDGIHALRAMRQPSGLFPYSTKPGHEWMTTEHGAIARDPLCEHVLLAAGKGSQQNLAAALERFLRFHAELRVPTKKLYDYFNSRGHGAYFFFFAHRHAQEAAALASKDLRERVRDAVREATLAAREADGSFMDHHMIGRAYGTAAALLILAE